MKKYNRVMLGQKSKYAVECFEGGFIGTDFGLDLDLTGQLDENWRDFNKKLIPVFLSNRPDKSKVAAGLACGMTWTVAKGLNVGDVVLCPDGTGRYRPGEITGDYYYAPSQILFHRRPVKWFDEYINRSDMSPELQRSTGSIGTCCEITSYAEEIEGLIKGKRPPIIVSSDETVEDPSVFALEKHLEDFLVANWSSTELGKTHDIFEEDGELVGQQYPSDTGPIDILAVSKDKKELLVVELKKGRASDSVVGQIQRYMGFVMDELAEDDQDVKGVIIALEDDLRIRRALKVTRGIEFYRYEVSFKLSRQDI
jgi:restriction system protein